MNIEELITDLRARVNPQYYEQIGTESYERHQCVQALESLLARIDVLREDAERYRWLSDDGGIHSLPYDDFGCGPVFDLSRDAIDAARGVK